MVKVVVARDNGGPEVLQVVDLPVGKPGQGEVRIRQGAAGVNFADTMIRAGTHPSKPTRGVIAGEPQSFFLGGEGAGVITDVGPGVTNFKVGDRVGYVNGPAGAYAEERVMSTARLVHVPAPITDEQVAGMMMRGLTAWSLNSVRPLHPGETVLVQAAAGGVSLMLVQWARSQGATVIGTVSTEEKANVARAAGCAHIVLYRQDKNWPAKVRELSNGGVNVVYDGVGKDTFLDSLDCIRPKGWMIAFGNASGPAPAILPGLLTSKGSLVLTRPSITDFVSVRTDYEHASAEMFDLVQKGTLKVEIGKAYPLAQAAQAHKDLEDGRTTGSTILVTK